jgi:hypothetical protein
MTRIPAGPAGLTAEQIVQTGQTIAALQLRSGMIEWFPGGHCDPWNHVESAMALATVGKIEEAEAAYQWLADIQLPNGAWHNYYLAGTPNDPHHTAVEVTKYDTNCVAYLATGVWHQYLVTGDVDVLARFWPTIDAALSFVLTMRGAHGEIIWAREPDDMPWDYALLTGSSSIAHSLGCALRIAERLGQHRPEWVATRNRVLDLIVNQPELFEPKQRWAMDWYYPVLAGAVTGDDAAKRLYDRWDTFVMDGLGVLCVSDQSWVTTAETCECVMALLAAGERSQAEAMFEWSQSMRQAEGDYLTGVVHPQQDSFPHDERSVYSAAAVILAADALDGQNPTSTLFIKY